MGLAPSNKLLIEKKNLQQIFLSIFQKGQTISCFLFGQNVENDLQLLFGYVSEDYMNFLLF